MDYTVPAFFAGINICLPHFLLRFQLFDDVWKLLKAVLVLTAKLHGKNFTNELYKKSLHDEHKQHMESFPWSHRFLTNEKPLADWRNSKFCFQKPACISLVWARVITRKVFFSKITTCRFFWRQHHVGSVKGSLFHVETLISPTAHPEEFSSTGAS